jgi:hypothetical protein
MALLPLICGSFVALIVTALLLSSSWCCRPCCNGIIIIIDVISLAACQQAGIVTVNVQASLPLLQWRLLLSSPWRHCHC